MVVTGRQQRIHRGASRMRLNLSNPYDFEQRISVHEHHEKFIRDAHDVLTLVGVFAVFVTVGTMWITGII